MNLPRYLYIIAGFVGLVLVTNLLILDFFLVSQRNDLLDFQTRLTQLSESFKLLGGRILTVPSGGTTPTTVTPITDSSCPFSCVSLITMATVSARQTTVVSTPATTTTTAAAEYFVPLGSGSVTAGSDWTNIESAQASFDAGKYGSVKAAYFEVFMRIDNGTVQARLIDTTTPAVFFSSQLATSNKTSQLQSAAITLSSGTKTYKVQMKSDLVTGVLDQARIRIVTQ